MKTENLNKENFWNQLMEENPLSVKLFCDWMDEYKKIVGWDKLFNDEFRETEVLRIYEEPKFHDIPYEMQIGILIKFFKDKDVKIIINSKLPLMDELNKIRRNFDYLNDELIEQQKK